MFRFNIFTFICLLWLYFYVHTNKLKQYSNRNNQINDEGALGLIFWLQTCSNLIMLDIDASQTQMSELGIQELCLVLQKCINLKALNLNLSFNNISQQDLSNLSSSLLMCQNLINLILFLRSNEFSKNQFLKERNKFLKLNKLVITNINSYM
ncbi:transmembrane protein, putative (macronuclear) [Tetrahymena thermophila SB210]|uniref:Transmembrane protein, putative n=1 Tax=Tetrahymena thermophila (strain SB210) TaxID=312017 RepID=W7XH85_TETTS|nr:transmembrane protein, putative [Tetrahymena thermophila SB210]EWS73701.1 transmembrane protein, putative [Tetrahymena thermophila SB210]|eukprot:XP_012653739.1 transmembrane protein, putative [Tetrahymena thermophila SB210]